MSGECKGWEIRMTELVIVYWRDIPAQIIVGKGRKARKKQLSSRFEEAIDRCAMKVGATGTDSYLSEWRRGVPIPVDGDPDEIVKEYASKIESQFDRSRLKSLIDNSGWQP